MTIAEKLYSLREVIIELEEKYCDGCQEWDCDNCWAELEDKDETDRC